MPSINDLVQKAKAMKASGATSQPPPPSTLSENIQASAPQDLPVGGGLPQRGMFPANMVLDADRNDSSRAFRGAGLRSAVFPFPVSQNGGQKTIIEQTGATTVVAPSSSTPSTPVTSSLEIAVNNIPSAEQNFLNLLNGVGISIAVDGSGNVTISGSGSSLQVEENGAAVPREPSLNFLPPISVSNNVGNSSSDVSVPDMVGDSGSGGVDGLVPAPPAGSFASGEFLTAGGTWAIPPGTGGAANYQTVQQAGSSKPQEAKLNFLSPFVVTDNSGNSSSDISIVTPGIKAFTYQPLTSPVALTANTQTLIDSATITMPATGGPWYVRVNYYYSISGASDFMAFAFDGSNGFAGSQGVANASKSAAAASGLSPVTYSNGAVVTFSVQINTVASGSSVVTSTSGFTSAIICYLEIEVIASV